MISTAHLVSSLLLALSLAACSSDDVDAPRGEPAPTAPAPASADTVEAAHVAVVERRIAASNAHDWATWQSLHTDSAVRTAPELPGPLVGAEAMRAGIEELIATFPDYTLSLVEAFGQGDRLVARIHTRATMTGPMDLGAGPIAPTGAAFEQDWVAVLRFEGDRIAAIDEFHDNYGILVQLGLAAAP